MHAVMPCPGLLRSVHIETGTQAEVPGAIRVTRHIRPARAGIGCHDDQAQFGSQPVRAGLLHEVLVTAGQPAQPVQHRQPGALLGLRRQVHGEHHVAVERARTVPVALVPAAEAFLAGDVFQGHMALLSRRVENREAFSTGNGGWKNAIHPAKPKLRNG
ncbi:hypothetical protein D9M68_887950 [compost metagenome]